MDALTFLEKSSKSKPQPMYAVYGDEDFLKREVRLAIVRLVLGEDPSFDLAVTVYPGEKLDFSTVRNELDTLPFVGPARVVIVENADPFVSAHRDGLERYLASPSKIGKLILDVKTFPETTKLAKALPDVSKIVCKAPTLQRVLSWIMSWAKSQHSRVLEREAAEMLIDLVGPQMGLLAQEIEKLAVAVPVGQPITVGNVMELIGRSRSANVFHIMNAIGDGQSARALKLLNEVFEEGEEPIAVLGALTGQLRKLAAVGRLTGEGHSLGVAMDQAGVPKWPEARLSTERQVKFLGRRRLASLLDWLIEINLGLKGGNHLPNRMQVERLIVKLARQRD